MSSMSWVISDACNDGRDMQFKLFDTTNNLVWPGNTTHWIIRSNQTIEQSISCKTNARICYGGRADGLTTKYWGVDLDKSKSCSGCCFLCQTGRTDVNLTCM